MNPLPEWHRQDLRRECLSGFPTGECGDIHHRHLVGSARNLTKVAIWPNFVFAVGGLLLSWGGSGLLLANRLRDEGWDCCPDTDATILSASICLPDNDNCPHIACVIYVYQVQNENYSGLCVKPFLTRRDARQFVDDCYARTPITKYRPECPQESCLILES